MRIILTTSAEAPGFRISTQWVMRLLIVALLGAFGCTPAAIPSLAHRAIVAYEAPPSSDAELSGSEPSLDFAGVSIPVLTEGEIIREETLAVPVSKIPTNGPKKLPAKLPRPDDSARIASIP